VTVKVYQGERPLAADNRLLAMFNLEGIPPAPRGVPQIEVTFDIDHNGILHVSAKDLGTGKEQKVRIEASSGLSQADIERMRREAESHAEEDRRKRELIDARNQADQMIYQIEKLLKEHADKLSEADRSSVQAAIAKVKEVMNRDDAAAIRRAVEELQTASHAMAQHLYQRGQATGAGTAGKGSDSRPDGKGGGDVIDAEFEVKK
jgi:molecular chaperone DnaK